MDFYNLASRAWNVKLFPGDDQGVLEYIEIAKATKTAAFFANCPALDARLKFMAASSNYPADHPRTLVEVGRDLSDRKDLLWRCAFAHGAEAEGIVSK